MFSGHWTIWILCISPKWIVKSFDSLLFNITPTVIPKSKEGDNTINKDQDTCHISSSFTQEWLEAWEANVWLKISLWYAEWHRVDDVHYVCAGNSTYLTIVLDTSLPFNKTLMNADQFCISVRLCFSGLKSKNTKQSQMEQNLTKTQHVCSIPNTFSLLFAILTISNSFY